MLQFVCRKYNSSCTIKGIYKVSPVGMWVAKGPFFTVQSFLWLVFKVYSTLNKEKKKNQGIQEKKKNKKKKTRDINSQVVGIM